VAIDRCSRFVFLAVYDAENAANAVDFLRKAKRAFPFRITHILTDRGSCFTADAFETACTELKVPHGQTKAYTPQTAGHADLEILLTSFNQAYNRRRQRALHGLAPIDKVAERLKLNRGLENKLYKPPADQNDLLNKVDKVLYYANEVSQPDS